MNSEYKRVFRAFADNNRVRVLEMLCEGEKCACALLEDLQINQSTLSHHMKILCDSGIVKSRKVGKWSYYSINDSGCAYAGRLLNNLAEKRMTEIIKIMSVVFLPKRKIKQLINWCRKQKQAAADNDSGCDCSCCK